MYNSHAEICPVCKGSGRYIIIKNDYTSSGLSKTDNICHGCNGKGWVTVSGNDNVIPYTDKVICDNEFKHIPNIL